MKHTYWVIEKALAGRPGPDKFPWDLAELAAAGIGGIISLAWSPESERIDRKLLLHLPVYQPMIYLESEEDRRRFLACMPPIVQFIDRCRSEGKAALVHCYHGCDRTGAVLASYLVARENLSPETAVEYIRKINPEAMSAFGYAEAVTTFAMLQQEMARKSE